MTLLLLLLLLSSADAQPTDAEREVWDQVDVVLKDAKGILDELQAYKGAGQEIREVQSCCRVRQTGCCIREGLLRVHEPMRMFS